MLLPLWSLLDQPSPPPPPPPRPSDNSFIWGLGGGGGGGGWPNQREIECAQRAWVADQIAYRECLRQMGLREGGMVRRARRLPRHTYVSSRRVRPSSSSSAMSSSRSRASSRPARAMGSTRSSDGIGSLMIGLVPRAKHALVERHRRRNGEPDMLVASAVGIGAFVGTKAMATIVPVVPRCVTSSLCTTGALYLTPKRWAYRDALIVGCSVATLDELLKLIA